MKEFDKWYNKEDTQKAVDVISGDTDIAKMTWRAALEWIQAIADDNREDNTVYTIRKELNDNIPDACKEL